MSISVSRRSLLRSLPALSLLPCSAPAETSVEPGLLLNAADSLQHYLNLLYKVSSDAFEHAAKQTGKEVENCNVKLEKLRDVVTKLQMHLKSQKDLPELQARFHTLEQSLSSMRGERPGQENAVALQALPETLDTLRGLMNQVAKTCDLDTDGETAKLIDEVYGRMKEQNEAVAKVAVAKYNWSQSINEISNSRDVCESAIGDAAIAVAAGAAGDPHWKPAALHALDTAIKATNTIISIQQSQNKAASEEGLKALAPDEEPSATVLHDLLAATATSLDPHPSTHVAPVAFLYDGQQATPPPPGVALNQDNSSLIAAVRQLVHPDAPAQPKYFTPGITSQIVNCIAVCLPIWLVYTGNDATNVGQRKRLIGSAIYFGLIHGTVPAFRSELRDKLQDLYHRVMMGGTA